MNSIRSQQKGGILATKKIVLGTNQRSQKEARVFKINSKYKPSGDQPQAIKKLVDGIKEGAKHQTLLGVTGSRENFYNSKCNRARSKANYYYGTQ